MSHLLLISHQPSVPLMELKISERKEKKTTEKQDRSKDLQKVLVTQKHPLLWKDEARLDVSVLNNDSYVIFIILIFSFCVCGWYFPDLQFCCLGFRQNARLVWRHVTNRISPFQPQRWLQGADCPILPWLHMYVKVADDCKCVLTSGRLSVCLRQWERRRRGKLNKSVSLPKDLLFCN